MLTPRLRRLGLASWLLAWLGKLRRCAQGHARGFSARVACFLCALAIADAQGRSEQREEAICAPRPTGNLKGGQVDKRIARVWLVRLESAEAGFKLRNGRLVVKREVRKHGKTAALQPLRAQKAQCEHVFSAGYSRRVGKDRVFEGMAWLVFKYV